MADKKPDKPEPKEPEERRVYSPEQNQIIKAVVGLRDITLAARSRPRRKMW